MSARRKQSNSDPLPYVQVDRAVKPKSALLAGKMGVTNQHALGSLVEFWDLCGDPRELERVAEATPEGEEPQLVLERSDVELRFELASGHRLEVGVLLLAGLVEPQANRFRVRGMSRYFDPIQARIRARRAASVGGKASVESRRKSRGTAQPTVPESFEAPFDVRFESASETVRTVAERLPNGSRSDAEATPNPSGQRSAVSGQRPVEEEPPSTKVTERGPLVYHPPGTPPGPGWKAEDFFRWFQACRQTAGFVGEKWPRLNLSHWWAEVLGTPGMSVERLCAGVTSFGQSEHWRGRGLPFGAFAAQWRDFVPALRGAA